MAITFKQELHTVKKRVDIVLEKYLDDVISETKKDDVVMAEVFTYLKKTILAGGKRVRPAMTIYGHIAAGGELSDDIVQAAAGVELVHIFLLIHDDVIDRDDLRHGIPTIHAQFRGYAKRAFLRGESEHFGISTAIITGDYCHALGNKMIFTTQFAPEIIVRALIKLQEVVRRTGLGEFQDVVMGYAHNVTEKKILQMYENKTAKYTLEGPAQMGAILAGADEEFCESLSRFTIPLGIAFQIQDDILGIYGAPEKTGKPVGSDIEEGKTTLLVSRARSMGSPEQKETIKALLGKEGLSEAQRDSFREALDQSGALDSVRKDMECYLEQSRRELAQTQMDDQAKNFFGGLINYLEKRDV